MRIVHWVGAMLSVGAAITIGCGSSGNGTCTSNQNFGPGAGPACGLSGGTCSTTGGACGPNMHAAITGSQEASSCSNNYYSDPAGNCGVINNSGQGLAPAPGTCCLPDEDAGADASDDGGDGGDAAPGIGSCSGTPCDPGCACGLLPGPGTPTCFCEAADAGKDAATPTCGSIYCFAGCSCADVATSACTCP